jgi:hypothetical protein
MGYVSLLIIPFLWLAGLPVGDGDGWHVARVMRGHARAFWISPGMDRAQVRRLLGEDGVVSLHFSGSPSTLRDYLESDVGVVFEKKRGDIPRVATVFSWPILIQWLGVEEYLVNSFISPCLNALPDPLVELALSSWEQVIHDAPSE